MLNIPVVSGLEVIGNPIICDGSANFIQVYVNDFGVRKPYFRADIRSHNIILKNFLKESNISEERCEWIGGGVISKAQIYSNRKYSGEYQWIWPNKRGYAVSGQCGPFQKYPDIEHFNSIQHALDREVIIIYDKIRTDDVRLTNDDTDHEEWQYIEHDYMLDDIFDEDEFRANLLKTFNL
jgi:hypothetical protein